MHTAAIADDVVQGLVTYALEARSTPRDGGGQRAQEHASPDAYITACGNTAGL